MEGFDVSSPINVKQFLSECRTYLTDYDLCLRDDYMGDKCVQYPESFDVSKFSVSNLLPKTAGTIEFLEKINDTKGLKVLEKHKETELQKRKHGKQQAKSSKFTSDSPWIHKLLKSGLSRDIPSHERVQLPDILIKVHFYRAVNDKNVRYVRISEFDVLGQSSLHSLKEKLHCPSDDVCNQNFAENPDASWSKASKDIYKSNFFFIEGTFYNDMSSKKCIDLSTVIREWAEERKDQVGPFKYVSRAGVKFIDLTFRLGQPYLYMHQGDCEHLIIFSDVRVVCDKDCNELSKYPLEIFMNKRKRISCQACGFAGKWIACNSSYSTEDPGFFCDLCLKMLHYDENNKLHDINLRVYLHPSCTRKPDDEISYQRSRTEPIFYV